MNGLWGALFPNTAAKIQRRRWLEMSNRDSVSDHEGVRSLRYYPSDTTDKEAFVALSELEEGGSANHNTVKIFGSAFLLLMSANVFLIIHLETLLRLSGLDWRIESVLGFMLLTMLAVGVLAVFVTNNCFKDQEVDWNANLASVLANSDTKVQMLAFRDCLLSFRSYIKWRRFMTYVIYFNVLLIAAQFGHLLTLAFTGDLTLQGPTWLYLGVAILLQLFSLFGYAYMRWVNTNWRSPTLQLCVALAEWRGKYNTLMTRGAHPAR